MIRAPSEAMSLRSKCASRSIIQTTAAAHVCVAASAQWLSEQAGGQAGGSGGWRPTRSTPRANAVGITQLPYCKKHTSILHESKEGPICVQPQLLSWRPLTAPPRHRTAPVDRPRPPYRPARIDHHALSCAEHALSLVSGPMASARELSVVSLEVFVLQQLSLIAQETNGRSQGQTDVREAALKLLGAISQGGAGR